jgi:hypothetical protein
MRSSVSLALAAAALLPISFAAHAEQITYPASTQVAVLSQPATPAQPMPASQYPDSQYVVPSLAIDPLTQPDLISFGADYIDFDKNEPRTQGAGFRLEYRGGHSFYSTGGNTVNFQIHPLGGIDVSTREQLYGFGGFAFDVLMWKHFVFTESEAVGLFDSGDAKPLGSFIEFRSQAELGYRFDNNIRITAQLSHISNAGLTHRNPGEEMAGGYIHIPVNMLFGH